MRIRWTPLAADDLEEIDAYLAGRLPHLRRSTIATLYKRIQSLRAQPQLGRHGIITGTRELICAPMPYLVSYRIQKDTIEILRIRHTSRKQ